MSERAIASPQVLPSGSRAHLEESYLARLALRFTEWAEKWFPDAYIFAAIAVIIVACAALLNGATPTAVAKSFGDGFWSLIPFTMQMAFIVIGGYVVATSPPAMRLIEGLAAIPKSGRSAIVFTAFVSLLTSLISWGFCAIFSGLLGARWRDARNCAWTTERRALPPMSALALPGPWA